MRKLLILAVAVALTSFVAIDVRAEEGSELEISGNVTVVSGYQRPSKNAGLANDGILADGLDAADAGVGGEDFGFYLDQVEIDLAKSFGENIRIRADIDFTPNRVVEHSFFGAGGSVDVEQGYVTANIPVGNGMEFLIGKFNSGIGLDPIDRNELSTVSFSTVHRTLLPHGLTGMRFGYDFSEATRLEFYVVNDLADNNPGFSSDLPSGGFNLSYAWGDEGNKSWIKLTGAGGPESIVTRSKKGISFLGDLAGHFAVSDAFWVSAEGVYRQDDTAGAGDDAQFIGGQLKGRYAFSDVWDGTLRYSFIWDLDSTDIGAAAMPPPSQLLAAPGLGANGTMHSVAIATGYQITDGARFVVEGGADIGLPSAAGAGTGFTPGLAGMFTYSF